MCCAQKHVLFPAYVESHLSTAESVTATLVPSLHGMVTRFLAKPASGTDMQTPVALRNQKK